MSPLFVRDRPVLKTPYDSGLAPQRNMALLRTHLRSCRHMFTARNKKVRGTARRTPPAPARAWEGYGGRHNVPASSPSVAICHQAFIGSRTCRTPRVGDANPGGGSSCGHGAGAGDRGQRAQRASGQQLVGGTSRHIRGLGPAVHRGQVQVCCVMLLK